MPPLRPMVGRERPRQASGQTAASQSWDLAGSTSRSTSFQVPQEEQASEVGQSCWKACGRACYLRFRRSSRVWAERSGTRSDRDAEGPHGCLTSTGTRSSHQAHGPGPSNRARHCSTAQGPGVRVEESVPQEDPIARQIGLNEGYLPEPPHGDAGTATEIH